MKSGTFFRNCIIGVTSGFFISSCCCFGARGINFDMRKAIVDERANSFSGATAVNTHWKNNNTVNGTPYKSFPFKE